MKRRIFSCLRICTLLLVALALGASCAKSPDAPPTDESAAPSEPTGPAGVALREDDAWKLYSPEGRTVLTVAVRDGELCYSLSRDGKVFLEEGALGLTVDGVSYGTALDADGLGDAASELRTDVRRVFGRVDEANAPCLSVSLSVGEGETAFTLEARVFETGAAFRYRLPGDGERTVESEQTSFVLPAESRLWAGSTHIYYESRIEAHLPSRENPTTLGLPATVALDDGRYVALLEADLAAYAGICLRWTDANRYTADFSRDGVENVRFTVTGEILTPWRVLAVADDLNELVNNTILYQLCEPADEELFADDWVKPGRAVWSWITGRTTDRVTPELMRSYTDAAGALGFEYNLIDEGWVYWDDYETVLKELSEQGKALGVGQLLWTGVIAGAGFHNGIRSAEEAEEFLSFLAQTGMSGGKIDFFPQETDVGNGVDLYRQILQAAAEKRLLVDFHGCNKPTGYDVTWPNELGREAILGLESTTVTDLRTQAQMFTTQVFTRNLAGHADFTPAVDTAFHLAQLVLTDSPLQVLGTDPETLFELPTLEMVKSVPTVWKRTVVLEPSRIGSAAVFARESEGGSWFVGGINYQSVKRTVTLNLSDFLGEGTYRMELWTDAESGLAKEVRNVTKADTVELPFPTVSGFLARFDRVTLSQYGGELYDGLPVLAELADPSAMAVYTLDGSQPDEDSARIVSGQPLPITEGCTLRVRILDGDGAGSELSCRFVEGTSPRVRVQTDEDDSGLTVTLSPNFSAPLHYTTDGSEPNEDSPVYGEPLSLGAGGMLRLYAEPNGQTFRLDRYLSASRLTETEPDLQLTDADWLSATTGYPGDPATKDRNTKNNPITIDGTVYSRGLGTNAVGSFTYAVPDGAKRFVAVCGIDDNAKVDANYVMASSQILVSFDGAGLDPEAVYYRTRTFVYGEKVLLELAVPAGAETITITCGDAGDGNTCDNVSLGNPGWMLS